MSTRSQGRTRNAQRALAERTRLVAETRLSEERLRVFTRATQAFSEGAHCSERVLELVVRELAQAPYSASAVLRLTEDGTHFTVPHVHAPDAGILAVFRSQFPAGDVRPIETYPALERVVATQAPHFVPIVPRLGSELTGEGEAAVRALVRKTAVTSLVMVPLKVEGRVVGALCLVRYGDAAPPLDDRDVSLVQSLAEHIALALTAADLLQRSQRELAERQKLADRLSLLSEVSRQFGESTGDYEQLLALVAHRLADVVGELCSVCAVSDDGQMLEPGVVHHADPEITTLAAASVQHAQRVGQCMAGKVATSGQSLFAPKVSQADWATAPPRSRLVMERLKIGSVMAVPLRCRDQVVGVATLARSGSDNPYTEDDLRLAEGVADRAALAISNARSYRAERAAREETVRAYAALRESELGHRLLFESSPVPIYVFSVDSLDLLAANPAALRFYGYSHKQILGLKLWDLRADRDETDVKERVALAGSGELTGIVRHRRADGRAFFVEFRSSPMPFQGHRARLVVVTDVASQYEAERMRSLLSAIVQSSNDAIVSKDLSGVITSWNGAAERLFGYSHEDAVGKSISLLIPGDLRTEEASLLATITAGEPVSNYETVRRRKDGSLVHVSLSLSPILDASGKVVGASKTARDLTSQLDAAAALRKTEEQLHQAQKMDAIGRLAGGIAHDFNNSLSVILGYSGLLLNDLATNDPSREDLDQVCLAATRAADLTRQLLTFSRQQVVAVRVLDLNHVLAGMDKMLRRIIGEDIDLVSLQGTGLGYVLADPSQVDQVIMNLVVNARDAMPMGGKLTIETANVELDAEYTREHLGARPGPHVMLAVSDTGHGMDSATQARIFEPFFTTKELGKGTGLGLSTVFGIAQQAGGSVCVYSELGKGTAFKVYFPLVETEADEPKSPRSPAIARGTETILLVEDQEHVRAIAENILKRSGYRVITSRAPGDALVSCEQHQGRIDLLLTDVVMPQLGGLELSARVTKMHPETKVLFMSGYTDDSIVRHGVLENEMAFLQKPFTPESLAAKVRDVLDGRVAHNERSAHG